MCKAISAETVGGKGLIMMNVYHNVWSSGMDESDQIRYQVHSLMLIDC